MKQPSSQLLLELGKALLEAEHQNIAEHMVAGLLWSIYPEWFKEFTDRRDRERRLEHGALVP